ncbi:MAG: hypothetical protein L0170_02160 [Acidobacteria bacterium]|nr:hypothetical protein [Acidobacteriota bacterium]
MAEFVKKNCVAVATNGGNDIEVVTAAGTIIVHPSKNGQWNPGGFTLNDLTKGLEKFNALPEAERKPKKLEASEFFDRAPLTFKFPAVPPGMLTCRLYIRAFERDAKGELRRHEGQSTNNLGPNGDFMWLTETEWKSLVPANPTVGLKVPVPSAIARRIFVYHLIDSSMSIGKPWEAEHVRSGGLTLTVEEVSAAGVRLQLEGSARMADHADFAKASQKGDFSLVGVLNYDSKKQVFDRFDIAALGDMGSFKGGPRRAVSKEEKGAPITLGYAFELASPDSLGYGVTPAGSYFKGGGAPMT